MESLFFLSKSFWIFLIQSFISFFNPDSLDEKAKVKLFESGIDTGIIYLRSEGFNATYDEFTADYSNNTIVLRNLSIKKEFEPSYTSFCLEENIVPKSIWHPYSCEFSLEIEEIILSGLDLGYKSENPSKIELKGIKHNLSIYNNTELMTLKKLVKVEDYISANLSIESSYEFSKNIFQSNINLEFEDFGKLNFSFSANDIIYNEENFSFNLQKFNMLFEDKTFIEKIETLRELDLIAYDGQPIHKTVEKALLKRSTLNVVNVDELEKINSHNDFINSINYHYPNYENNVKNLILFFENSGTLYCQSERDHLMNELFLDEVNYYGFPLLIAAICENITYETG